MAIIKGRGVNDSNLVTKRRKQCGTLHESECGGGGREREGGRGRVVMRKYRQRQRETDTQTDRQRQSVLVRRK